MSAVARAYVGLGSNLDVPVEQVRAGMAALRELPDSHVLKCSSLYRTAPIGVVAQPDFINAVCALDTALIPQALMRRLLAIENARGRRRGSERGGPRTLDLDLLLYENMELQSPELTLPHPRLHERAFVLHPLFEIAPTLNVPGLGPINELLSRCGGQRVARLNDDVHAAAKS
jgi:2-amino-4-hydroxy-6-hydroxymethyldihydropteridine diphosphokinase